MSRLAAGLVENFLVEFLGEEPAPEPEAGDKQKDKTQRKHLRDVFLEACPVGFRFRTEPDDVDTYSSLAQTIAELGIGG